LKDTSVKVVEIIPPAVDTETTRGNGYADGVPTDVYVEDVISQLLNGETEIGYQSDHILRAGRAELDGLFKAYNGIL
jgi:uncharacterized oxidoreductase